MTPTASAHVDAIVDRWIGLTSAFYPRETDLRLSWGQLKRKESRRDLLENMKANKARNEARLCLHPRGIMEYHIKIGSRHGGQD